MRLIIYPSDMVVILGKEVNACRRIHKAIRDALQIETGILSVEKFCSYMQLNYDEVMKVVNPPKKNA